MYAYVSMDDVHSFVVTASRKSKVSLAYPRYPEGFQYDDIKQTLSSLFFGHFFAKIQNKPCG